jgi:long-chain acyl-CoA synthetase
MGERADGEHAVRVLSLLPQRIHQVIDRHAAHSPDRTALIDDQHAWSYAQLAQAVEDVATEFKKLDIRPGDRIMIVSENCIEMAALLMAASRINAWAIVVNPRLSARELDQIREHSGARRMLITADVSAEAKNHAVRYHAAEGVLGPLTGIAVTLLDPLTEVEPIEQSREKQVAVLIYTSGTTGTPKGVMLTHENLLFSALTTAEIRNMTAKDKQYIVLPVSHIVGISLLIMSLMSGATARLAKRYDPAALLKAITDEGITLLNGVPATYQRLLEHKAVAKLPALPRGALRLTSVAGAPLDPALKSRVEQELGLPLLNGYGITECSPGLSGVRMDSPRTDVSVGPLLPGIEAKIMAPDGAERPPGEVGELHVRGRNVMKGYYRAPDLTVKAISDDGWFNTGDLARIEDESLFIVGRTKEMIIRSGFNVYPAEIEAVLGSHPLVVQSAVVGRAAEGNEEVVAFVQILDGADISAEDLMEYVRPQLTSYKRPSEIIMLPALPATSSGKILKHVLAQTLRV